MSDPALLSRPGRHRVVIVGAGFGGLSAAKALARSDVDIVVVDRQNHHLFQPLLYQVATAGLSPADIAAPIRFILRRQRNARVLLAEVTGVDPDGKAVIMANQKLSYDTLVIATGARHSYFGQPQWAEHAPGLKTLDDATFLRRKILLAFEKAEQETDPEERRRLQTFVVVGGGPTGVEMAGAIAELARRTLAADFHHIDPRRTRVVLIEGGANVLAAFPGDLSVKAIAALNRIGVDVRLGRPVVACDAEGVSFGDTRIESRTVVWAAGVEASPAGRWLMADVDRAGRVKVGADLTLPGHPDIFVIGDTAQVLRDDGKPLPGVAPVAKQQGADVGQRIAARLQGRTRPNFRYRDSGAMATIGRKSAVADLGLLRLSGWPAWLLWCVAHVYFLIGFRNRFVVAANWIWNYLTFQRGARLITGVTSVTGLENRVARQPSSGPAPSFRATP